MTEGKTSTLSEGVTETQNRKLNIIEEDAKQPIEKVRFKDMRTGEIKTQFSIMDIMNKKQSYVDKGGDL